MVRSVIITGRDLVPSAPYQDTYKYTFPTGMVDLRNHEVAIASVNIWYSWYNISAARGNNTFSYKFPINDPLNLGQDTYEEVSVTIPDGNYSIEPDNNTLNAYLQFIMVQNNHYLIDDNGDFVYYIEIVRNITTNLAEIVCYGLPTVTLPSGWAYPTTATWTLPNNNYCPQIVLPEGFARILGYTAQSIPTDADFMVTTGDTYTLGTSRTLFYPVTNIIVGCSLLHNTLSVPNTNLFQFPISSENFNFQLIKGNAFNFAYQPVDSGYYTDFIIRFYDQNGERLYLADTDIGVSMVFRKRTDDNALTK